MVDNNLRHLQDLSLWIRQSATATATATAKTKCNSSWRNSLCRHHFDRLGSPISIATNFNEVDFITDLAKSSLCIPSSSPGGAEESSESVDILTQNFNKVMDKHAPETKITFNMPCYHGESGVLRRDMIP